MPALEVFQAVEGPSGQDVGFDRPKTSLFARFAISMADRMAEELKAVAPGEGVHLGNDHGNEIACGF